MTQRNGSSYLPIIYLLGVMLSLVLIHLSLMISSHYHRIEIRNVDQGTKKSRLPETRKITKSAFEKPQQTKLDTPTYTADKEQTEEDSTISATEVSDETDFFTDLMASYQSELGLAKDGPQSRTDVIIRYYKKDKDADVVYDLRKLGFYIHQRAADNEFDEYPSNSIFYGDSVKKQDIIVVAHSLISSGVKIQNISLSKFHDTWKAHSIEIGTDTASLKKPAFTLETLRKKWESM